jgi:transcriptional regulator with XRE-family HTH domain
VSDLDRLQKFLDGPYRASYLEAHVKGGIAYQIQALREKLGLNQTEFGVLIGKPQSVISRLESTEYGAVNVNTLLEIADRLKVGLQIRFCNFQNILDSDTSPQALAVENIEETVTARYSR